MSNYLNRAGTFKARATGWSVRQIPTGSVAIRVTFTVHEVRNGEVWCEHPNHAVTGDFFVFKQTGAPNDKVHDMLREMLGWGGRLSDVYEAPPPDHVVQIQVDANEHKGKTYYQAAWIRDENSEPRTQQGDMTREEAAKLDAKLGIAPKPAAAVVAKQERRGDTVNADGRVIVDGKDYGDIPF